MWLPLRAATRGPQGRFTFRLPTTHAHNQAHDSNNVYAIVEVRALRVHWFCGAAAGIG